MSDPGMEVISRYGVVHAGKNIALPAVFIITRAGKVAYRHVAKRVWDRPSWKELEKELRRLFAAPMPDSTRRP